MRLTDESVEARMWDALVDVVKSAYTAGLDEGTVPRTAIMPLVRGELVGLIWVRPLKVDQNALTGIAELANIAAVVGADEVVLAWGPTTSPPPASYPSSARHRA